MSKTINPEKLSKFDRQYLRDRSIDPDEYVTRMTATDEPEEVEDDGPDEGEAILSDGTNAARAGRLPADGATDDEEDESDEDAPYSEWTNDELRAELKRRELPTAGKQKELVERLEAHDAEGDDEDDA